MFSTGICLGASSISMVILKKEGNNYFVENTFYKLHNGKPKEYFLELYNEIKELNCPIVITGRKFKELINLPSISEPEAVEYSLDFLYKNKIIQKSIDCVASLGGETLLIYSINKDRTISDIFSKNQCASGTGEFFLQQIKRMNLSIDDALKINSNNITPFKVSGRCSVFCKSDCTHALNKGTPKEEVTLGLSKMIADKINDLINQHNYNNILLTGGLTKNNLVVDYIKLNHPNAFYIDYSYCFEALGAAYYGIKKNIQNVAQIDNLINEKSSTFTYHKPLKQFSHLVEFNTLEYKQPLENEECILGLDVGSTTTKAVLISYIDAKIIASEYLYTNGDPIGAAKKCYQSISTKLKQKVNIIAIGTTGSGRHIAAIHALTEGVINEILAHSTAAVFFDEEVDTIFEIGGQDAKYTYIVNKVASDYAMNEACSAGTGSFIEEAAYESLGVKLNEIESMALSAKNPPNFSDQCAAFISSDIKNALHENILREDIIAGLVYSICLNYINRVKGNRKTGSKIFMQGGVCYNKAIPIAMAALTNSKIIVPPEPGLMGAYGVALAIKEKIQLGLYEKSNYDLIELSKRDVIYHKPFVCNGGREKCDLKCNVNVIEVNNRRFPFGGACNKYYNIKKIQNFQKNEYDYVSKRNYLTFKDYIDAFDNKNKQTIGINLSFQTFNLFPLYFNFFDKLGFDIILPDENSNVGTGFELSSMCWPAQLSLGMFNSLIDKNPDYYFLPSIMEMETNPNENARLDFNCTCVFVSGEPIYLKQSFKNKIDTRKIISPILNFSKGYENNKAQFLKIANQLGIKNKKQIDAAFEYACYKQREYEKELKNLGKEILSKITNSDCNFAMVIFGRAYNSFTEIANKGIPQKFSSKGIYTIPYDILPYENNYPENMYWESGKKILAAAKYVNNEPKLFATYITNFSCGPDSMIISSFREIMAEKPSLTLELDGHTADAGITTRIDAAIDIINNYIKLNKLEKSNDNFVMSKVEFGKEESFFIDSEGNRLSFYDKRVKLLIPSMGELNAEMFAAALRSLGYNCEALPPSNSEIIKLGKSVATGKECLPVIILAGSLLNYLFKSNNKDERVALFNVQGAGNCRLGQYPVFLKQVINNLRLRNVAQATLMNEDGFAGFGPNFAKRGIQAIIIGDVLEDIRSAILCNAKSPAMGIEVFNNELKKLILAMEKDPENIDEHLKDFATNIRIKIPAKRNIEDSKFIALLGEIYVRRDLFTHRFLNERLAERGFILKIAHISEWIYYVDYLIKDELLEPDKSFKKKIERELRYAFMKQIEQKIKKILSKTNYYKAELIDIDKLLKHSKHIIPLEFKGEPGLTLGTTLYESFHKYCGIINIGPFGCMPTRLTEAVSIPEMNIKSKVESIRQYKPKYELNHIFYDDTKIPFLTLEVDGNPFPQLIEAKIETFILQAERAAQLMELNKKYSN